jgi:esterase/lipase superfamily enzyme
VTSLKEKALIQGVSMQISRAVPVMFFFCLVSELHAQPPDAGSIRFKVVSVEEAKEDADHTAVHFVTNRLIVHTQKDEPKWKSLQPYKLFLKPTDIPLAGYAIVKRDQTPEIENNSDLKPFTIQEFQPQYNVRVRNDEDTYPFIRNELLDDGMSFLKNFWKRDVLIYIHGYNNDWPTAIRRAAQLKRDFKKMYNRDFSILVYSWPSLGGGMQGLLEYSDDERRYQKSLSAFAKFLDAILLKDGQTSGRGKRWVLAHSMGNRVFLRGFAEMGRIAEKSKQTLPRDLFTRVVLAAPDMEIESFETHTNYLYQFCESSKPVLYFHAASNIAVNTSEFIHFDDRAGVKPVVSEKLLTIDAKAAKSPWSELGHGYYASNDKMLKLIADYFFAGANPSESSEIESVDGKRWRMK